VAGQYDIVLYEGHATPKDIVLRSLPTVAIVSTVIYLVAGHATPNDIVLRDVTQQPGGGSFPTQFAGLRAYYQAAVHDLCLVAAADAATGMGAAPMIRKGGVTYAIYLVETTDPNATPIRIATSAGTKAIRVKT